MGFYNKYHDYVFEKSLKRQILISVVAFCVNIKQICCAYWTHLKVRLNRPFISTPRPWFLDFVYLEWSRTGWMRPWASWPSEWCPHPWWGVETRGALRLLPTQAFLLFCDSRIFRNCSESLSECCLFPPAISGTSSSYSLTSDKSHKSLKLVDIN